MNNKRRFFVAGACLAAVLICAPVQTVYAQPEGVTTEDAAKTKKMEAPAQITLENLGFGQLQISWTAVEGASEYRIYRSATETGGYKKIADVTDTMYTDTVTTEATHYYKVVAMRLNEKGKRVRGKVSAAQVIEVPSDIPQVTAVGGGTNGMTVQWSSVDGAQEYVVYRSTKKGKGYKKVTTTALTSYTDIGAESGSRYYYKVAAGRLVDGVMKYQAKSPAKSGWTAPSAPTGLTAAQAEGGIDLKWTAPKGATYYRVYRAVGSSTSYTLLADKVKKNAYTDVEIAAGENYSYYVVAAHGTLIGGKSTAAVVNIGEIKVNTRTLFLGPGVSATLNEQSALPGKIGFVSENPAVATVNADGKVTGVAAGKTQIQVTVGVVSTSVTVTVTDCPVNGIDVSKWQQDIKLTGTPGKTVAAADIADDLLRDVNDRNTQRLYLLCGGFLKAVHLAHLDYHAVHRTALQMNLQFTHGLLQLLSVHVVIRNHIPQKILTQQRTALLVVTRKQRRGGSILRSNGAQAVQQLLRIEVQLEQIVPCAQLERLLDQFELVVAAQHQNFRRRALLPQLTDELDAVHARHFDISNDDVRLLFLYELHRLQSVRRLPDQNEAVFFPVNDGFKSNANHRVVIRDQYARFSHLLSPISRRCTVTQVRTCSSLSKDSPQSSPYSMRRRSSTL